MKKQVLINNLSIKEIKKAVLNSQKIEGYKKPSKALELKVIEFMKKNNVKVSI